MRSFVVVHNIPSPYRLHLFRVLNERLRARGVDFHVHFMAHTHHDRRHWRVDSEDIPFSHTFWRDVGPFIRGMKWHFNPGLVVALAKQRTDYLLLGGPWTSLTGAFVSLLARRTTGIAWLEGNTQTPGRINGLALFAKRFLLSRFQFLAVPGKEGKAYTQLILSRSGTLPRIALLPNIVDESLFTPVWQDPNGDHNRIRSQLNVSRDSKLAIWPARLIPTKGTCEFLSRLTPADICGWQVVILGQGPLKNDIEKLIVVRGLKNHIRLVPYVPYALMPSIYGAADLFLLPSLADPNPLSVVEAMHAGLPLLISFIFC